MIVRAGDDELVGLDVLVEHELPGIRAFDPQILRRVAPQDVADFRPDHVGEPIHASLRMAIRSPLTVLERDEGKTDSTLLIALTQYMAAGELPGKPPLAVFSTA